MKKNDKPCSSRALFVLKIRTPFGKVSQNTAPFFPGEPEFVMCQFCYPTVKENKMKLWKRHVLTTDTVCKHWWHIRYETDMGPELSTAAADQNFAWMALFTKLVWCGPNPYRTTVRTKFGYVNGTFRYQIFGPDLGPDQSGTCSCARTTVR